ncbi:MAG TPA: POTRA domain-containing protein, partial [Telluria sp.]
MQKRASQQASSKQHCLPGHQSQRAYGASFWPAPGAGAGRGACLLGALLLAAPAVQAQTPPGAGSVLRESAPAGAPPVAAPLPAPALPASPAAPAPAPDGAAGVTFVLREVSFSGNSVFSAAVLAPLAARDIGRTLGFDDLGEIAARVTGYYQRAGYVLTQVVLPPQDVAAGQVRFSVIEGRLGQVRIERLADLSVPDSVVRATLAGLVPGQPLKGPDLERAMLLLSDLPGLAPQSSLESGNDPGTFDLIVELKPAPRLQVSVDADNYGSRATRQYRAGAFARVNSPFGVGDNLDLRLLGSAGKGLKFGRIGYEAPLGYRGWRAGVSYAYLEYELGKELAALDASGRAGVFEAALSYPVLRARTTNLFARLSVERKALFDQIGVVAQS